MKRLLIATALTASLATAGLAATEAQETQIESFLPTIDASTLNDTQVTQAMQIINSSDSRGTKMSRLDSIVRGGDDTSSAAMISDAEMAQLQEAAPNADLTMITQAQADTALLLLNSSDATADEKVQAVLMDDQTSVSEANSATMSEMVILERYLEPSEIMVLSENELVTALSIVYGGDSPSEKTTKLESLVN